MRIAKPILLVSTPLGVFGGLYEAYHLAGGLVILAAAMVGLLSVAALTVILTLRKEAAAEQTAKMRNNAISAAATQVGGSI
jgi:hypothetical protein